MLEIKFKQLYSFFGRCNIKQPDIAILRCVCFS